MSDINRKFTNDRNVQSMFKNVLGKEPAKELLFHLKEIEGDIVNLTRSFSQLKGLALEDNLKDSDLIAFLLTVFEQLENATYHHWPHHIDGARLSMESPDLLLRLLDAKDRNLKLIVADVVGEKQIAELIPAIKSKLDSESDPLVAAYYAIALYRCGDSDMLMAVSDQAQRADKESAVRILDLYFDVVNADNKDEIKSILRTKGQSHADLGDLAEYICSEIDDSFSETKQSG